MQAAVGVLAQLVRYAFLAAVALIVAAIVLKLAEANPDQWLVAALLDAGYWLAGPFREIFTFDDAKLQIAVNFGIAAIVYWVVGSVLVKLIDRLGDAAGRREQPESGDGADDERSQAA